MTCMTHSYYVTLTYIFSDYVTSFGAIFQHKIITKTTLAERRDACDNPTYSTEIGGATEVFLAHTGAIQIRLLLLLLLLLEI